MLKGKQRSYLKSLANNMRPITQIGKEGLTEEFLTQLDDMLRARELVKVSILDTAGLDAKEAAHAVCEYLRAEYVQSIGSKFTIYRKNRENPKIVFPGGGRAIPSKYREAEKNKASKRTSGKRR